MSRNGMQRVYVGDVGVIPASPTHKPVPNIDLDTLTNSELFAIAVECGMPAKEAISISNCLEHTRYKKLQGLKIPDGVNFLEGVVYCNNCWEYFLWKA